MNDNLFGRLKDLIVKPTRLMDNVGEKPQWWVPGLIIFFVMIAISYLTIHISGPEQMEAMRDSKLMQLAPEETWQQQYEDSMNPSMAKKLTSSIGAGFTTWLLVIIFGFILGFFARMGGGEVKFKKALGIVSWASLIPFALASLCKLPLILATESVMQVNFGLAALLPDPDFGSPLFTILTSYGDFFSWWGLFLLIVGFERVANMTRAQAATTVILTWALLTAIPVGIGILFMG